MSSQNELKMGDPIWIPNPYPSAEPLDSTYVTIGPGVIDEDPKGRYRQAWCPSERSERPVFVPAVLSKVEDDGYVCSTVLDRWKKLQNFWRSYTVRKRCMSPARLFSLL